ncbi:MAG: hypothetical protein R3C19_10920 [Planctomycetaceae bacterium]
MNVLVKSWFAVMAVFLFLAIIVRVLHDRHGSRSLTGMLALASIVFAVIAGERVFRYFNSSDGPK